MSLSTLNNPTLITGLGAGSLYALQASQQLVHAGLIPLTTLKSLNLIAYTIQTIAVSVPGRLDDEVAKAMMEEKSNGDKKKTTNNISEESKAMLPGSGRTLVAPAGWAFAIWGPIYLGEAIFVVSQMFMSEKSSLSLMIRDISAPFTIAHIFQTLWTAAFRPKYKGNSMYISAGLLGGTAYSLSKAHSVFTATANAGLYSTGQYFLNFFPLSLHFGWTTAATLVNLNGAFASNPASSSKSIAIVGHLSVVLATALGVSISVLRSAPVYGSVIAWALLAVDAGMNSRIKMIMKDKIEDKDDNLVKQIKTQKLLSKVGAYLCLGTAGVLSISSLIKG